MKPFNQLDAEHYLNNLIKRYRIKIHSKRSTTSCGWANRQHKEIKIPIPTNEDRFGVCLHEVKHIIDGDSGKRYWQEFQFHYDTTLWEKRMRWYVLSRVAMATNRGHKDVCKEIQVYFSDIDFTKWYGKKVFVSSDRKFNDIRIEIGK
jgi:hypothetical protein